MTATIVMKKNIHQMGIVCTFKESDFFLHNICGNELQRWVQHFPLQRAARTSTYTFCFDDLVAWYLQNYRFYPRHSNLYPYNFFNSEKKKSETSSLFVLKMSTTYRCQKRPKNFMENLVGNSRSSHIELSAIGVVHCISATDYSLFYRL